MKHVEVIPGKDREIYQELNFHSFPPGSVIAFKVNLPPTAAAGLRELNDFLNTPQTLSQVLEKCGLVDLNVLLYRHSVEEHAVIGTGSYEIPGYGPLVYCGLQVRKYWVLPVRRNLFVLQGFASVLYDIQRNNDLGHSMCGNLRDGNWMMDYIVQRLHQRLNLAGIFCTARL